jgi:hypothetical protein
LFLFSVANISFPVIEHTQRRSKSSLLMQQISREILPEFLLTTSRLDSDYNDLIVPLLSKIFN